MFYALNEAKGMIILVKKIILFSLCLILLVPATLGMNLNTVYGESYSGASDWAKRELDKASEYGLVTDRIKNSMSAKVTREEFAEIAVKLYEKYTAKAATVGNASFVDTKNPEILKAANLGLVAGVGNNKYAPGDLISRQQMAAILLRALKVINPDADYSIDGTFRFADDKKIASWAKDGVYYCVKAGIAAGVGNNMYNPEGNASREQSVIVCTRAYEFLTGKKSTAGTSPVSTAHPSQARLKLPTGFPAEIPFADDAFNVDAERQDVDNNIFVQYQSEKKYADVLSMYRNFFKNKNCQETIEDNYSIFISEFSNYNLFLMVSDIGTVNVAITLSFPGGIPDVPTNTGNPVFADGSGNDSSGSADSIETNQGRLKLPAFLPKEIPFAKDAELYKLEDNSYALAHNQMMTIVYNSKTKKSDVVSLYKSFTRNSAEKNNEMDLGSIYTFSSTFKQYKLTISVSDSYTGTGKTQVTLIVEPMDGVFQNHYAVTDYSNGCIDNSGVANSDSREMKRLVAGPRLTDPFSTNIFIRKDNNNLWAYGTELYAGAVKSEYGDWKPIEINKKWTLVDSDAYCLDTEGNNYFTLKSDGSLWTYGSNSYYFLGNGEINQNSDYPPVKILDNVRSADIGKNGIAVKKDESLWIWGVSSALFSVLDNPEEDRLKPEKVMDNVVDAVQSGSIGWDYGGLIMVLKTDGSLWTWGEGNCGDGGTTTGRKKPIKIMNGVKAIEASNSLCCVIKTDNSLWVWESHVTGLDANVNLIAPTKIMDNVKMVSPGERFLIAMKNDGTVWSFGDNTYGQCGVGSLSPVYLSKPKKILEDAVDVSATDHNAFALMKNGKILGWGINDRSRKEGDYDWLNIKDWRVLTPTDTDFNVK